MARSEASTAWRDGMTRPRWLLFLGLGLLLVVSATVILLSVSQQFAGSSDSPAQQAAVSYARGYMHWYEGPTVRVSRQLRVRELAAALRQTVPQSVRQDVNTDDLVRRYGPNRRLDLIILSGRYYSLPPDEGRPVSGDVVMLVDPTTNRIMLLTA